MQTPLQLVQASLRIFIGVQSLCIWVVFLGPRDYLLAFLHLYLSVISWSGSVLPNALSIQGQAAFIFFCFAFSLILSCHWFFLPLHPLDPTHSSLLSLHSVSWNHLFLYIPLVFSKSRSSSGLANWMTSPTPVLSHFLLSHLVLTLQPEWRFYSDYHLTTFSSLSPLAWLTVFCEHLFSSVCMCSTIYTPGIIPTTLFFFFSFAGQGFSV